MERLVYEHVDLSLENTMTITHQETEAMATRAWTEGRIIYLELTDQQIIGFPANRFRRLKEASRVELAEV